MSAASAGLTCTCCSVLFTDAHLQREHYKTDWHRYNLKRKITGFPAITEEQFRQKVLAYKKELNAEKTASTELIMCQTCNKYFQSSNAYDNHVTSKKHKENKGILIHNLDQPVLATKRKLDLKRKPVNESSLSETNKDSEESSGDYVDDDSNGWVTDYSTDDDVDDGFDDTKGIPKTDCLFCNSKANSVEENLKHMSMRHGFFLPDAEFCTDVDGMLKYLGLKVGSGNICLTCNERRKFFSLDACQKHMRDKGHCRVAHSAEQMLEFSDFYDYSPMYPGGDGEESSDIILLDDGYTLTLPSGAKIGHRSLLRYYKQHLKPLGNEQKNVSCGQEVLKKVIGQYKALGWTGTSGPLAEQRAKDIRLMKKINSADWLKLGLAKNKLFKSRGRSDQ